MTETSGRLLKLLSLLQTRRDWPGDELASRLEVSGRTIRRDIERLRSLGYPVEASTGPLGGYRLHAGAAMPPLLLDDDEAVAIAVGLRTAAGTSVAGIEETAVRALVKLEQVLPSHLRRRVQAMQSVTAATPDGGPTVDPGALTVIATATRDRERVRFGYTGARRQREPAAGRAALAGQPRDGGGTSWPGTATAGRGGPTAWTGSSARGRPAPASSRASSRSPIPPSSSPRTSPSAPQRHQARLTLHAPAEELRDRHPYWRGQFEPLGDDRCEFRTGDDSLEWLAMRVCMLGVEFEVHEPPELVGELAELGGRIGRATARAR